MTGPSLSMEDILARPSMEDILAAPSATQVMTRNARKTPAGLQRLEQSNADLKAADEPTWADYAGAIGTQPLETLAAGVPGGQLAVSLGRKALTPSRPLADIQREVNTETSGVPYFSAAAKLAGSAATIPFLPASGAAAGAILGGASGFLNNDPTSTAMGHVGRAVLGAGVGGIAGRLLEGGQNFIRGNRVTNPTDVVANLKAERSAAGDINYPLAADQGRRYFVDLGEARDVASGANRANADALQRAQVRANAANMVLRDAQSTRQAAVDANNALVEQENAIRAAARRNNRALETAQTPPALSVRDALDRFNERSAAIAARNAPVNEVPWWTRQVSDPVNQPLARTAVERAGAQGTNAGVGIESPRGPGWGDFGSEPITGRVPAESPPMQVAVPQALADIGRSPVGIPTARLSGVLRSEGIAPYADIVRSSERFDGADDATIAREAYRLMSEAQGRKLALTGNAGEFKAATDFALKDLGAAKNRLGNAMGEVMPSFPNANLTHSIISGDIQAARTTSRMFNRDTPVIGSALDNPTKDPRAWLRDAVPAYTPHEAAAAQQTALGTIGDVGQGFTKNPFSMFGAFGRLPLQRAAMLRALDAQVGATTPQTLRNFLLAGTTP